MQIRKTLTIIEETRIENGVELPEPLQKVAAIAVIKNPFAGEYAQDLNELIDIGEELGRFLGQKAVAALNGKPVESYGKAAIVGERGELEHAAALLHPKLGKPFREAVQGGLAIIPSAKKRGAMGTAIDIPLHYKNAAFVRSHYDAMEVRVTDAPTADEIVVALAVTSSGRPLARIGGLQKHEATAKDGLK